jgi:hypothetical protein
LIHRANRTPPTLLRPTNFTVEGKALLASPASVPPSRDYGEAGISIDRFDGTMVGQQLEEVTE